MSWIVTLELDEDKKEFHFYVHGAGNNWRVYTEDTGYYELTVTKFDGQSDILQSFSFEPLPIKDLRPWWEIDTLQTAIDKCLEVTAQLLAVGWED